MKVGDLVKLSSSHGASFRAGLIVDLIEKKCWRTKELGPKIDWNKDYIYQMQQLEIQALQKALPNEIL